MKHSKLFLLGTVSVSMALIMAAPALALPMKYNKCEGLKIKDPAGSRQRVEGRDAPAGGQGFYMSEDCKIAYVLPPEAGRIEASKFQPAAGENVCGVYNSLFDRLRADIKNIDEQTEELEKAQREFRRSNGAVGKIEAQCDKISLTENSLSSKVTLLKAQLARKEATLAKAEETARACKENPEDAQCDSEYQLDIDESKDAIAFLKEDIEAGENRLAEVSAVLKACVHDRTIKLEHITRNDAQYSATIAKLDAERVKNKRNIDRAFKELSARPGAVMAISFFSDQQKMVTAYQKANPALEGKVSFRAMPISDGVLTFLRVTDGVLGGIPVLQKVTIAGLKPQEPGIESVPFTLKEDAADNSSIAFGAAAGGMVVFDMYTSCSLQQQTSGLNPDAAAARVAQVLNATATFKYQVGVKRNINIKYNEKHLYCLIRKQSSRGGLFRTSTESSITQTADAKQWLDIEIKSEDRDFDYAKQENLALEIRREMLDGALHKVATSYLTNDQAKHLEPGEPAAPKMAAELRKCPNMYCQFGALALDLGSALFGGTDSNSSSCKDIGSSSQQNLLEQKSVVSFGTQAFQLKGIR